MQEKQSPFNKAALLIFICLALSGLFLATMSVATSDEITDARLEAALDEHALSTEEIENTQDEVDSSVLDRSMSALGGNCRYGISSLSATQDSPYINDLGFGWKVSFATNFDRDGLDNAEYVPMIRFAPNGDNDYTIRTHQLGDNPGQLGPLLQQYPGRLWLVGNEVDRHTYQDSLYPQVYARAYHDVYHFIKERDPSAQVAVSGLVQVTPNRIQYLDIVMDTYQKEYGSKMPVDVWNIHTYVLPERVWGTYDTDASAAVALGTDPNTAIYGNDGTSLACSRDDVYCYNEHDDVSIMKDQIRLMRTWMASHGESQKPLIISEYGVLFPYDQEGDNDPNTCFLKDESGNCFTPERTARFADDTSALLDNYTDSNLGYALDGNRMVQRWLWFSLQGNDVASWRLVADGEYTPVGDYFRDHINSIPLSTDLVITGVGGQAVNTDSSGVATVTLSAEIRNRGNTATSAPQNITFYSDSNLTNSIAVGTLPAQFQGCTTDVSTVSAEWTATLSPGVHHYWAKAGNSVMQGTIIVDGEQVFLPIVTK